MKPETSPLKCTVAGFLCFGLRVMASTRVAVAAAMRGQQTYALSASASNKWVRDLARTAPHRLPVLVSAPWPGLI